MGQGGHVPADWFLFGMGKGRQYSFRANNYFFIDSKIIHLLSFEGKKHILAISVFPGHGGYKNIFGNNERKL